MTAAPCRAGPVCPAVTGVGIRLSSPPSAREVSARSADGGREVTRFSLPQSAAPTAPSQRGPNSAALPRCHSEPVVTLAWESATQSLPLRGRCQREALTEGEMPRVFSLPQSAAPTAPSQRGPDSAALPRCHCEERSAAAPRPTSPVKITIIHRQILCTYPKCENFAGNGCERSSKVLYLTHTS